MLCLQIGHIQFDPRRECRDDCYVSLPTHIPGKSARLNVKMLVMAVASQLQFQFFVVILQNFVGFLLYVFQLLDTVARLLFFCSEL